MSALKMCVNTQTPLIQFLDRPPGSPLPQIDHPAELSQLVEGLDYRFSPGGVTRMVLPLLRRMIDSGFLSGADWVALNPSGPETIRAGPVVLHHVSLASDQMASYGKVKEALWSTVHGTSGAGHPPEGVFWTDDFAEYAYYNRRCAETITRLDRSRDFDVFYVHDFQQLPVGHMLGTLKPKVFRWHIPFDATMIPVQWGPLLSSYFNSYDVVIVSSDRYLESLRSFGFTGKVRKLYPYVDPAQFSRPPAEEIEGVARSLGIEPEDEVVLTVARMDPMKGQDRAIRAVARLARDHPHLKLVLVGNGSFSGSRAGMGLSKSAVWRRELETLVGTEHVEGRVVFAGHLPQRSLDAMYERSALTLLPSVKEGFGLVVVESWLHRKAPIITDRAGIAELVRDGRNGRLVDPDDLDAIAGTVGELLDDRAATDRMGQRGAVTARRCSVDAGVEAETKLIQELV